MIVLTMELNSPELVYYTGVHTDSNVSERTKIRYMVTVISEQPIKFREFWQLGMAASQSNTGVDALIENDVTANTKGNPQAACYSVVLFCQHRKMPVEYKLLTFKNRFTGCQFRILA